MELTNERNVKYTSFDIENISEEDSKLLVEYGLKHIKNDKPALINYAVNKLLIDYINNKEKDLNSIIDDLPEKKQKKYKKKLDKIMNKK